MRSSISDHKTHCPGAAAAVSCCFLSPPHIPAPIEVLNRFPPTRHRGLTPRSQNRAPSAPTSPAAHELCFPLPFLPTQLPSLSLPDQSR